MAPVVAVAGSKHPSSDDMRAACVAHEYMKRNWYLAAPGTQDRAQIVLDMWDGINYRKNGIIDWDSLIASRRGLYENRLRGVVRDGNEHLVVYELVNKTCVRVSADWTRVKKLHGNCQADVNDGVEIGQENLNCGS